MIRNKKREKIIIILLLGIFLGIVGVIVEFIVYRYTTNRSSVFSAEDGIIRISGNNRDWAEFLINGVNFGPREPLSGAEGRDNANKDEYARRFKEIAEKNANTVRVFTIQPPAFYQAFFEHNLLAPRPLFLLQGIHIDNLNIENYNDAFAEQLIQDFSEEIRQTIDVIHGKAVIKPGGRHAAGTFSLDVSPYVMGYILCDEPDEDLVASTNQKNSHIIGFDGDYLYTENASPWEAWLAGVGNYVVSYEADQYGGPYKLVSWITRPLEGNEPLEGDGSQGEDEAREEGDSNDYHIYTTEKYTAGFLASPHDYSVYPDLSGLNP